MKDIKIRVVYTCDLCKNKEVINMNHEPDVFEDSSPFSPPYGWMWFGTEKHYCSIKCLNIAHPETKNSILMAQGDNG